MAGKVVVLGGGGAMARAVLRDLIEFAPGVQLKIIDQSRQAAENRLQELGYDRITAEVVDVTDQRALVKALAGWDVVVNCVNAGFLEACQRAALAAGIHYIDLGSWPDETGRQLAMHDEFKAKDLIAVLGMGSAPGISNMMARFAVDRLDTVESLHIKLAKVTVSPSRLPLNPPYSLATILDELTVPATVLRDGQLVNVPAQSEPETVQCPPPMGSVEVSNVIHPEPFTFYHSFASRGLKESTFKIGLPAELLQRLRFLLSLGIGENCTVEVDGQPVNLRRLLLKVTEAYRSEVIEEGIEHEDYGYTVVTAVGTVGGQRKQIDVSLAGRTHKRWGLSGGTVRTGVPASIAAQMILRGDVAVRGAMPPEQCIDPGTFFQELSRRDIKVFANERIALFRE